MAYRRELTAHKSNPVNDRLTVASYDGPGPGGAHHLYLITGLNLLRHPGASAPMVDKADGDGLPLVFQCGPIAEHGVNGITHEALLAVLIDRLECFQAGPYACAENAAALLSLREALRWLGERTAARVARGVEGTSTV